MKSLSTTKAVYIEMLQKFYLKQKKGREGREKHIQAENKNPRCQKECELKV